jgi:hypothetical protein
MNKKQLKSRGKLNRRYFKAVKIRRRNRDRLSDLQSARDSDWMNKHNAWD